ncbi:DUF3618 domain-containing protein [Gulosibacter massiliensis]|uniref:DUF3618 domain-containing protein n=1 Tax=Gulosibacter massiliensis TaxID=2479839 RepID=UPI000F63877E|nr:DUF3618 domain-containing protein [Gulosibacter massiliensis]
MTPPRHEDSKVSRSTAGVASVSAAPPEPEKGASQEEIEADIERTRRELGETVEALAEKFDVKSQARRQIAATKHRVAEQTNDARQHALGYLQRAEALVIDEHGKPTTYAWIGVATIAATMAVVVGRSRKS